MNMETFSTRMKTPTKHPARKYTTYSPSPDPAPISEVIEKMDYEQASVDSFDSASRAVAEKLTRSEHLDNLDQFRKQVSRKKATVESQLRNTVQTQLDGIQNGLERLKVTSHMVTEVKEGMRMVEEMYKHCQELSDIISPIKEVNRRFQQLKTTNTHINSIFSVPDRVKEIQELIEAEQLLQGHQLLADLEHTRNDLLVQLYQGADAFVDKNTALHRYFEPVIGLSDALGQQLWRIITDVTEFVTSNPTSVVTALRIIQREEKADMYIADSMKERGIPLAQIPGRPKQWRAKCMEILETSITNKFQELHPKDMAESKEWLDDYLGEVATFCYQDLKAMKESGQKCFPPSYEIMKFYLTHYHAHLKEVISSVVALELNARDIIRLMIWVGDVRQSFREALGIDLQRQGPLIDEKIEEGLQKTCVIQVEGNVQELAKKLLQTDYEDWISSDPPEADNSGHFYTAVGIMLFEMIDQNISALAMLGPATKVKVLKICLKALESFQAKYREQVEAYYKDHKQSPLFFPYMIAVTNNCKSCIDFAEQLKKRFDLELGERRLDSETVGMFKQLGELFKHIGYRCCDILVEMMFVDVNPLLENLFTREHWFKKPLDLVNKIEGTVYDYNGDFQHLKQLYYSYIIKEVQQRVIKGYLESLMKRKMTLKNKAERTDAAGRIAEEAKKIGTMFIRLSHATNPKYIQIIEQFSELLHNSHDSLLFIIGGLHSRYPEVEYNHVVAVLAIRGDLSKTNCQKLMERTTLSPEPEAKGKEKHERGLSPIGHIRGGSQAEEKVNILSLIRIQNPYSLFK